LTEIEAAPAPRSASGEDERGGTAKRLDFQPLALPKFRVIAHVPRVGHYNSAWVLLERRVNFVECVAYLNLKPLVREQLEQDAFCAASSSSRITRSPRDRSETSPMQPLLMCAYSEDLRARGATDFLAKPFGPAELRAQLDLD
jgi:hypothetical protein